MYVFDTSSFSELFKFYPSRFPSLWEKFNNLILMGHIISVKEVYSELLNLKRDDVSDQWLEDNKSVFKKPSSNEALFLSNQLFKDKNGHFANMIEPQKILRGGNCADPFIVASAKINNFIVVTQEKNKPNSAKIPTVCNFYNIECFNFEAFMEKQSWIF